MTEQGPPQRSRPRVQTMREPESGDGVPFLPASAPPPPSGGHEARYAASMGLGFAIGCAAFTVLLLVVGVVAAGLWWGMSPAPPPVVAQEADQEGFEANEEPVEPVEAAPVGTASCLSVGLRSFKCSSGSQCRRSGGRASRDGDDGLSFEYFHEGCRRGDIASCLYLGFLHDSGKLGAEDPVRAEACYRDACEGGSKKACYNYGFMLEKGASDRAALVDAWRRYDSSCKDGHPPACKRRAKLCQSKNVCGPR